MKRPVKGSLLLASPLLMACGGVQSPLNPAQAADVAAYEADLVDCVSGSATRSQADACMAQVRGQWCGPGGRLQVQGACGDAGASASSPLGPTLTKLLDKLPATDGGTDGAHE